MSISNNVAGRCADVVVPVYGNLHEVRRCVESVLKARSAALGQLLVVDDASPDQATRDYLDMLAARGEIGLIRHPENRGFVAAVNAGMAASVRDVVLLNSDTEVHGDWLERLLNCAYAEERIGTVTPFSNNATICSYPWLGWNAGLPQGLTLSELDTLFALENTGARIELPTGIGFCLLIRRACVDEVGFFDVETFGRGYGEENDFCQRAMQVGWKNMLCADTFVFHDGGASFGVEREARCAAAEEILATRYPDYAKRVKAFILADPLAAFRTRVDMARVRMEASQAEFVIIERAAEKAWFLTWLGHLDRQCDNDALAEAPSERAPSHVSRWRKLFMVFGRWKK